MRRQQQVSVGAAAGSFIVLIILRLAVYSWIVMMAVAQAARQLRHPVNRVLGVSAFRARPLVGRPPHDQHQQVTAHQTWEAAAAEAAEQIVTVNCPSHWFREKTWLTVADEYVTDIASGSPNTLTDNFRQLGALALYQTDNEMADVLDLIAAKQHDYGHDNINRFGVQGIAVRLSDKIARLKNLDKRQYGPVNKDEAVMDSWTDVVGYCVIALMHLAGEFDLPLRADLPPQADANPDQLSDGTSCWNYAAQWTADQQALLDTHRKLTSKTIQRTDTLGLSLLIDAVFGVIILANGETWTVSTGMGWEKV